MVETQRFLRNLYSIFETEQQSATPTCQVELTFIDQIYIETYLEITNVSHLIECHSGKKQKNHLKRSKIWAHS